MKKRAFGLVLSLGLVFRIVPGAHAQDLAALEALVTEHTLANAVKSLIAERPEAPEASPETIAEGREVLSRFVASSPSLEGFALEGRTVLVTPQGELPASFEILFVGPDRYRESTRLPFGEIVTVVDADAAWASTPRGVQDLDADQARRTREGIFRHYPGLLWAAAKGRVDAQLLSTVPGSSEVLLRLGALEMRGSFDDATGRLSELTFAGTSLEGAPVEEKRSFSTFVDGFPTEVEILHDGTLAARTTIASTRLDPEVDEALFRRP
jgi:hypothetical protein